MSLTEIVPGRPFRPFQYGWAFDYFVEQEKIKWLPDEVPMGDDIKDYKANLTDGERRLITQIFRFFVTADQEVGNNYHQRYLQVFKPTEIIMMLMHFGAQESIHVWAYGHLIDTMGLPETEYSAFLQYKEMTDKYDYFQKFTMDNPHEIAKTLAAFGAFTEGLQLFASFAILLNFPRHNLMKGMGQIIAWSVRDEAVLAGTEVLTPQGWKPIDDITLDDTVLEYDMDTKEVSFSPVLKKQHVQRNETFEIKSNHLEQIVSPNHRMIIDHPELKEIEAKNLSTLSNFSLILGGKKTGPKRHLTDQDVFRIKQYKESQRSLSWILKEFENISSEWATEALELICG